MVGTYSTTIMTDRAIDVATEHTENASSDDPLFLYVAYQASESWSQVTSDPVAH